MGGQTEFCPNGFGGAGGGGGVAAELFQDPSSVGGIVADIFRLPERARFGGRGVVADFFR